MNTAAVFEQYVDRCHEQLLENEKALRFLARAGISERFVLESFRIGYADGSLPEQIEGNAELTVRCSTLGLLGKQGETLRNRIVVPVLDEDRSPVGLVGVSMSARSNHRFLVAGEPAVFNAPFLRNTDEIILTEDPLQSLLLIQLGFDNVTFALGNDEALLVFAHKYGIKNAAFSFDGKERLFYELSSAGVKARRVGLDFGALITNPDVDSIRGALAGQQAPTEESDDTIQAIESGFIFRFPLIRYRVIGSFHEQATSMKVNIKAFTSERVFVDHAERKTMPNRTALNRA